MQSHLQWCGINCSPAGAGKTFTMSGNTGSYEQRGLIPRTLAALLSSLRSAPGLSSWSMCLSYLEVWPQQCSYSQV